MLRATALSLILLATVAATLPAGEWLAEAALRGGVAQQSGTHRHTRAWWRRYRARLRRQHALAAERRRRRWSLRARPSAQADATPRLPLPDATRPDALSAALPSSLASIATIEQQVAPPAPYAPTTPRLTEPSPAAATFAASPVTLPAAQPAPLPARAVQVQASPALEHATRQKFANNSNAAPMNATAMNAAPMNNATLNNATANNATLNNASVNNATVKAAVMNSNAPSLSTPRLLAKLTPRVAPAQPRLSSPLAPTPSVLSPTPSVLSPAPLARVADNAPALAAPHAKAAPAPTLAGRDPHKFSALPVPHNWLGVSSTLGGEYKFSLRAADGRQAGVAVWSRVNLPAQGLADKRNRAIAGVAHASLRRTVIDRMVAEGGWVVNDFERDIAGQKVFVVVAQSESSGLRRAWTYYFVELDGQLFSLSTTAPSEFADSVASEAEQTLSALAARRVAVSPAQAGRGN